MNPASLSETNELMDVLKAEKAETWLASSPQGDLRSSLRCWIRSAAASGEYDMGDRPCLESLRHAGDRPHQAPVIEVPQFSPSRRSSGTRRASSRGWHT